MHDSDFVGGNLREAKFGTATLALADVPRHSLNPLSMGLKVFADTAIDVPVPLHNSPDRLHHDEGRHTEVDPRRSRSTCES
jgi:hypothetical protein